MSTQKMAPAALNALKQALTDVYWYKSDLHSFLTATLSRPEILAAVNWEDYKRNIVASVVDRLARNQDLFLADLVRLMTEVARIEDYSHLERLDDGKTKATKARQAVAALRKYIGSPAEKDAEEERIEKRRRAAFESLVKTTAVQVQVERAHK